MTDKYYRLTDWPYEDYVIREHEDKQGKSPWYYEYSFGPNKWVPSGLFYIYNDPDSSHEDQYEEVTKDEAKELLKSRKELLNRLLPLADSIAEKAHKGQVDKGGHPYIEHPRYVASQVDETAAKIVALLHDTIEDTDVTLDDLKKAGFPDDIVNSVRVITHTPNRPYMDYIRYLKRDHFAREVKLADLRHNMDESRLPHPLTDGDKKRLAKYHRAYAELIDMQ